MLPADEGEIQPIATALHDTLEVRWVAPAHCTGEPAFEILQETFSDRYIYAGLGTTVGRGANPVHGAEKHGLQAFFNGADLRTYRALSVAEPVHHDHGSLAAVR